MMPPESQGAATLRDAGGDPSGFERLPGTFTHIDTENHEANPTEFSEGVAPVLRSAGNSDRGVTIPFDVEDVGAPELLTEAYIPADAVLGTREYPYTASNSTAAQFMHKRVLYSNVQRVAQIRVAAGLYVDWDTWAMTLARLRLWAPAGWYSSEEWRAPVRWPRPTADSLLLSGRGAPFKRASDIPCKVRDVVTKAIEAANVAGPSVLSPSGIARALNVTAAFRREHMLWALGAMDASKKELRRQSSRRSPEAAERRRKKSCAKKEADRRAAGALPRAEYERNSIAAQARALGIKPDTLRARLKRAKVAGADAGTHLYMTCLPVPGHATPAPSSSQEREARRGSRAISVWESSQDAAAVSDLGRRGNAFCRKGSLTLSLLKPAGSISALLPDRRDLQSSTPIVLPPRIRRQSKAGCLARVKDDGRAEAALMIAVVGLVEFNRIGGACSAVEEIHAREFSGHGGQ